MAYQKMIDLKPFYQSHASGSSPMAQRRHRRRDQMMHAAVKAPVRAIVNCRVGLRATRGTSARNAVDWLKPANGRRVAAVRA